MRTLYDDGMDTALHPEKMFKDMKFDNAKDFVCGMPLKAGVGDTANYNGKVYGFVQKAARMNSRKPILLFSNKVAFQATI